MPIDIKKESCCGCWACINVCPRDAIEMKEDEEGFLYPSIDEEICSQCELCKKVCPVLNKPQRKGTIESPIVLASWNKDGAIRQVSSSGGVFSVLANSILEEGGIVFGAAFTRDSLVEHKAIFDKEGLGQLRGSKYLQSRIGKTYKEAQGYLKQGKTVLFSGTPCQIGGLYAFLGKEYENLLTCDIVCHGVPSPRVFNKYLEYLETHYNSKAISVSFRDKRLGWKLFSTSIKFEDNNEYSLPLSQDAFMIGFLRNIYLRPSCHRCPFTNIYRIGDITLADFWGIGSKRPDLDDDKGTSLILINTEKGRTLFKGCEENLFYSESSLEQAIKGNPCLVQPSKPSKRRDEFFKDFKEKPFEIVMKKYMSPPSRMRIMMSRVKGVIKKVLKKLVGTKNK